MGGQRRGVPGKGTDHQSSPILVGEKFSQQGEMAVIVRESQVPEVCGRKVDVVFSKNCGGFSERQIRPSAQAGFPGLGGAVANHFTEFFFGGRHRDRPVPDIGATRVALTLERVGTVFTGEDGCPQQVAAGIGGHHFRRHKVEHDGIGLFGAKGVECTGNPLNILFAETRCRPFFVPAEIQISAERVRKGDHCLLGCPIPPARKGNAYVLMYREFFCHIS